MTAVYNEPGIHLARGVAGKGPAVLALQTDLRRLGYLRWKRLHRLGYAAGALAAVHFFWRVKIDLTQPLIYGLVVAALLGVRFVVWRRTPASKRG